MQHAGQQHLIGDIEGHVGEQHGEQRDHDAAVAELGPRLDHLRQAEDRALRGVERHEQPIGIVKYWKFPRNQNAYTFPADALHTFRAGPAAGATQVLWVFSPALPDTDPRT